jgi:putative restriction endonuclease
MKLYLGVTDNNWFNFLAQEKRENVNFWQPGGNMRFRALSPNEPFLFKLKKANAIGGIGFFSSHTFLPLSMAWEVFREDNGCSDQYQLQKMILKLREDKSNLNPTIGCIVLTNPIFFEKQDWIPTPEDWKPNTQQGKSYSTDTEIGRFFWSKVEVLLKKYMFFISDEEKSQLALEEPEALYGNPVFRKVRLGQRAFRVLVTDAYSRKCAISGEKTLPVLDAAHIKPYSVSGPHFISNALLLRSDIHKLFDSGYITLTQDLKVEVSKRIKEEFENGREYYRFHGIELFNLPNRHMYKPEKKYIEWHNENVFKP